ncbi:3-hydroxyisobutyrate dehydrogenase-like beta-hydroxyacid dehydrogenase [Prauserella shujinwangii]|uniref:3-hydroxyisobutyrate dehydrogenase-like beta-hydroxyacid dehydrogenase n=1 Tax=Prauserella shujinwangii TaxID=1453103 RepID=A0A2T0LYF4_9PSEU|nr:NAD(P)-binding domain-containing protein [Prauserella shujinwangii]PRX49155.1 3-hydroxyisobutyrate dehydrogenase-like beta-hydroxyacid dehydrogenase [Prauserella shujinwangii]
MTTSTNATVTVLGLGEMGSALAGAFLAGGVRTTVWNRTPGKAGALAAKGAHHATTVDGAVAGADLVVVNVKGDAAAREVLAAAGESLSGRAVLNLTDGTSAEARETGEWVADRGATYLHGQIMTIAPGIGHPAAVIFYGGDKAVYERFADVLALLGGGASFVSADPGLPTLYGMAVHDTMWGTLNAFLHAAALLSDAGVELTRFLDHADGSLSALLGFLPSLAGEVDSGQYAVEYGALRHHLPSIEDLLRESRARGIDTALPGHTRALVAGAVAAGHGGDSYSRLVESFRAGTEPA